MKRILSMFLAGATVALAACGSSNDESEDHEGAVAEAEQEIVGGFEAAPHSYPWQVLSACIQDNGQGKGPLDRAVVVARPAGQGFRRIGGAMNGNVTVHGS